MVLHKAVKVSVRQPERIQRHLVELLVDNMSGEEWKENLVTNPQRTLRHRYPSVVKYGLGEATQ